MRSRRLHDRSYSRLLGAGLSYVIDFRAGQSSGETQGLLPFFSLALQEPSLVELHTLSVTSNRAVFQQANRHPLRSSGLSATQPIFINSSFTHHDRTSPAG